MLQLRQSILYGIEDARDNEVVINHFCALAAAATAAGCRSLPEWVDLRGGEAFLRSEIEKDMADAGVWVYIYVCVCVRVRIYQYVYTHTCKRKCMYIYKYTCEYICIFVCISIYICV